MAWVFNPFTGKLEQSGPQGAQGDQGNVGATGAQGTQGNQGEQGSQGNQGFQGFPGNQGFQGDTGAQGSQGITGAPGPQGAAGATGSQGNQGAQGDTGSTGNQGPQGHQGAKGDIGDTGAQGSQGSQGSQGTKGDQGDRGYQGTQGLTGDQGVTGAQGPQGSKGDQGNAGAQGTQGITGNTGAQGPQGFQGDDGTPGSPGAQGNQGTQGVTGSAGPKGDQGYQGDTGATGAQGTQGEQGLQGEQGDTGNTGSQGPQGVAGPQGVQGDTGDVGPQGVRGYQGDVGAQGVQGNQGDVGAQGATGSTGPQGSQGNQGNQGDTGPQGVQGAQGDVGAQGDQGAQGATGGGADDVARDNIIVLAWKLAIASSLAVFNLEDGVVDEFEDETGVDNTTSLNESYNSTDDYYSPASGATLDLMEYSTNALAQAAYVTNATYGSDLCSGGTATGCANDVGFEPSKAVDNDDGTWWRDVASGPPHWWAYELASPARIDRLTFKCYAGYGINSFDFQGWNGSTYVTIYSGNGANTANLQTFSFPNSTAYSKYRIYINSVYHASPGYVVILEAQMFSSELQSFSEATIKEQGSYALKGVASTSALNKTLTRTISSPVDLSGQNTLKFDIYSSRTGSNIKIGIHDSGGTTTEITPNITDADTWQTVTWDISAVSDANKNAIDQIIITLVNADAVNGFYIDGLSGLVGNMVLVSEHTEAETEPTEGRFLALVEPVDSITLNTDLKGWISNDDGSNYDQVTLTDEGYFDSTKKIYAGNVALTDRNDKTMKQKLTTHNNKNVKVHGWGMLWK